MRLRKDGLRLAVASSSQDDMLRRLLSLVGAEDLLDTTTEFITSAGDEYDIVVDYVKALRTDPVALQVLGAIHRRAAFSYSAGGYRLRGLLRDAAA